MPSKQEIEELIQEAEGVLDHGFQAVTTDEMLAQAIKFIGVLKAALEAAEKVRWQPIETAPKDGTPIRLFSKKGFTWEGWPNAILEKNCTSVLARWGDTSVFAGRSNKYNGKGDGFILVGSDQDGEYNSYSEVIGATHWQPLPTPPEGE